MKLKNVHNLDDLKRASDRRVPRMVAEFFEGGADDEWTLARNRAAYDEITLEPRYLVDVNKRSLGTSILGTEVGSPVILAPTGLTQLAHHHAEIAVAKAAGPAGSIFTIAAYSSKTMEDIAAVASAPLWLQLYLFKDRSVTKMLVDRAKEAGITALVLTVDVPSLGHRERDLRNGMTVPFKVSPRSAFDVARKPRWMYQFLTHGAPTFANMVGIPGTEGDKGTSFIAYVNRELFDDTQTWEDLRWLRSIWDGPIAVKGVIHPDDGKAAIDLGADAVIVSNHGGRQLDHAPASIQVLERMVDAVGDRAEVIHDGGIRRGTDVVAALALGAKAVMVGRPYWWGLAAGGQAGVARALDILNSETDRAMALVGRTSIDDIDRSVVSIPPAWGERYR